MKSAAVALLLLPLLAGCDRVRSESWKKKYLAEINYHYQTQQIKHAEIAVRGEEIENQKAFMKVLADRITVLEKELEATKDKAVQDRGPIGPVSGKVTAVAGEIGLVVLDIGAQHGLLAGDLVDITRDGKPVARIRLDRADQTWSAGKTVSGDGGPRVGDNADLVSPNRPK